MNGINPPFMKPVYKIFIAINLLATINSLAQSFDATALNKSMKERVLEVPKMEAIKTLAIFRSRIEAMKEVSFEGFCESRRLLFLKSSEEAFVDVEAALAEMNMPFYVKLNASFLTAKQACDSSAEIENSFSKTK